MPDPAAPKVDAARVVLRGLPPLLQTQLLYGLQERCRRGVKTELDTIRGLCGVLRRDQVQSILELEVPPARRTSPRLTRRRARDVLAAEVQSVVGRALSSPELERRKDVWDMTLFGHQGMLDFTTITQPWLRRAAMDWASEDAPRRRGRGATDTVRAYVQSLGLLSASLRLQRDDQGMDPTVLGRADIVAFLNRLAHLEGLEGTERISAYRRRKAVRQVGKLLRDCRPLGLTRPGGPLAGLPDDFAVRAGDAPHEPDRCEQGRAPRRRARAGHGGSAPQLTERTEELDAARATNRDLMAEVNRLPGRWPATTTRERAPRR